MKHYAWYSLLLIGLALPVAATEEAAVETKDAAPVETKDAAPAPVETKEDAAPVETKEDATGTEEVSSETVDTTADTAGAEETAAADEAPVKKKSKKSKRKVRTARNRKTRNRKKGHAKGGHKVRTPSPSVLTAFGNRVTSGEMGGMATEVSMTTDMQGQGCSTGKCGLPASEVETVVATADVVAA